MLSGEKPSPHKNPRYFSWFHPLTLLTPKAYDGVIRIASDDAIITSRNLGGKEGFLAGISSGAAIYAAIEKQKNW